MYALRLTGLTVLFCVMIAGSQSAVWAAEGAETDGVRRHTLKEIRDQTVIKQDLDYSCGAAALATLMSYYFADPTTEKEILDLLDIALADLPEAKQILKKKLGFSLLDLKKVAERKGYKAAGFELPATRLREIGVPVLVYVHPLGYQHFAVLRGVSGERVYLADPTRGNLTMSFQRFTDEYGGVAFVLERPGEEDITSYPAALGRPDDYARPDPQRVIHGTDQQINTGIRASTLRAR